MGSGKIGHKKANNLKDTNMNSLVNERLLAAIADLEARKVGNPRRAAMQAQIDALKELLV